MQRNSTHAVFAGGRETVSQDLLTLDLTKGTYTKENSVLLGVRYKSACALGSDNKVYVAGGINNPNPFLAQGIFIKDHIWHDLFFRGQNGMLCHAFGGAVMLFSLEHYVAPALDSMACLPSRQRRAAIKTVTLNG